MGRKHLKSILILGFLGTGLIVFFASASDALARAGGGGHFSGGGGGGSHGGGGGGGGFGGGGFGGGGYHSYGGTGGGNSSGAVIFFIIVAIIILVVVIRAMQDMQRTDTVRRGTKAIDLGLAERLAAQLKQNDPNFDAARFYQRVADAFQKIQAAWSAHDLRPMQPFVSDGVFERFGLQIREQQSLGYRDRMENVRVDRVLLAKVTHGDVFETATLRIDAWATDYQASLTDGKFMRGSLAPEPFTEFWTFIRRRGTASFEGNGLMEGNCPNCGGDLRINQNAACSHCGALVRSGRYDWVLCEITQESEWRPQATQQVPGYASFREIDAGVSTDDLEDRASVIFWRRAESDRVANPAPLRKVASDDFVNARLAHRKEVTKAGPTRQWFGEIGVGAVDTVALIPGDQTDRAAVRVTWSGTRFSQTGNGAIARGAETSVIREVFVLFRRHGVKSDPDKGITSAHCPNCGTPVSNSLSNGCESCGTVLNDGSIGWVLESVAPNASEEAAAILQQARSVPLAGDAAAGTSPEGEPLAPVALPSVRGLLIWVIKMSAADGNVDDKEQAIIQRVARRAGVQPEEVASLIAAAHAGQLDAPEPQDRDQVVDWLTAMISVAMVDGRLASTEAALLQSMGARAGLSNADIRLLIKKEQARVYAEARDAVRG
ncbi:MAG: hypothetical protein JWM57_3658 [Phycisphaerales bacterium]|nr:hypothetical protein [Phycisphaerales bacterium]